MDYWAQRCLEEMAEAEQAQQPPPEHTRDDHMADTVMDFLFASQDASTASLVWMMCLMAQYPDVLTKVPHPAALPLQGCAGTCIAGRPPRLLPHGSSEAPPAVLWAAFSPRSWDS